MCKDKYPSIFSPQMEAVLFIILQIVFATRVLNIGEYINNTLHLAGEYINNSLGPPWVFVRGHYLFRVTNSELRGTGNVQGQISEHIFAPHGGYCVYYP